MIRIAMGGIRITTKTTDRWGLPITYWQVAPWGYVDFELYSKLMHYQDPTTMPSLLEPTLEHVIAAKLKLLNSQSQVYQFNALKSAAKNQYIRMFAVLHDPYVNNHIKYVSWFDAYVKYPLCLAICAVVLWAKVSSQLYR